MTGYLITPDGKVTRVSDKLHKEGAGNLQALYEALGCDIVQLVPFSAGELWCDEEGLFKPEPQLNGIASMLLLRSLAPANRAPWGGDIVGTVYARVRAGWLLDATGGLVREPKG